MPTSERQNGPDFLQTYAETSLHNGLETNAGEWRARAQEWREDQQLIEQLQARIAQLERDQRKAGDRDRVLAELKTQLQAANDTLASATAADAA